MVTFQVLNNQNETIKTFLVKGSSLSSKYRTQKKAREWRDKLTKKYNEHFGLIQCDSDEPFIKQTEKEY